MKLKKTIGWIAISVAVLIACFWAYWGIIENFHEGWYHPSLSDNLVLMFAQYLSPLLITLILSILALYKNKVGSVVFLGVGIFLSYFVNNLIASVPFLIVGALIWFSDFTPKKWKYRALLILPITVLVVFGIEPIVRVSSRINDGNLGSRIITQNNVSLVWAPEGPGWPDDGTTWHEADSICKYLAEDGITLAKVPQHIWRLPTVEESVKSMQRHGENAQGKLNSSGQPEYETRPDKETPLWNPHSQVIYWWTSTEIDSETAYIIVYDGKIWERKKNFGPNYLGYRAVKETDSN